MASTSRHAEARVRQLCALGLPAPLVAPELLHALRAVLPFGMAHICLNAETPLADFHLRSEFTDPVALMLPLLESGDLMRWQREVMVPVQTYPLGTLLPQERTLAVSRREFERHDFYHCSVQPAGGGGDAIFARLQEQGRPIGVMVARRREDNDFSTGEKHALTGLLPHLHHALTAPGDYAGRWSEGEEQGLMLLDAQGDIHHLCPKAKTLLFHAARPPAPAAPTEIRPRMKALCRRLLAIFQGKEGAHPAVWQHENASGRYAFRAYWLNPLQPGEGMIGVTVSRQVPLPLKLLHRVEELPLSTREKEICPLLAQGLSYAAVAEKLCRSERTVITHTQNIFAKLGVENRAELSGKLLAGCA